MLTCRGLGQPHRFDRVLSNPPPPPAPDFAHRSPSACLVPAHLPCSSGMLICGSCVTPGAVGLGAGVPKLLEPVQNRCGSDRQCPALPPLWPVSSETSPGGVRRKRTSRSGNLEGWQYHIMLALTCAAPKQQGGKACMGSALERQVLCKLITSCASVHGVPHASQNEPCLVMHAGRGPTCSAVHSESCDMACAALSTTIRAGSR